MATLEKRVNDLESLANNKDAPIKVLFLDDGQTKEGVMNDAGVTTGDASSSIFVSFVNTVVSD